MFTSIQQVEQHFAEKKAQIDEVSKDFDKNVANWDRDAIKKNFAQLLSIHTGKSVDECVNQLNSHNTKQSL